MVEHVNRGLLHIPGTLGGGEQVGRRCVDRPVTIPQPQGIQDVPRRHVVLNGKLFQPVAGVVAPRSQQSIPVLVDHEGSQIIVGAPVFEAILVVGEDVDEVVAAVVAPRRHPLPSALRVVVGILSPTAVPAFQIARGVDHQTGIAFSVGDGLRGHAHHLADCRHSGGSESDVGQLHHFGQPFTVDQCKPQFRVVRRVKVGTRRPVGRGTPTAAGDVAVAADDSVDLVGGYSRVLHGKSAGQDGVCAQGLIHGSLIPAPVNGGVTVSGHRDLAPVVPHP